MRPVKLNIRQPEPDPGAEDFLWLNKLFTVLFVAALVLALVNVCVPMTQSGWPEALLVLLATATTLVALTRQLPFQNGALAALVIALIGGGATALGVKTDIPFGPFIFGPEAGPLLLYLLPWVMPLVWVVVVLNSRGVARLILRPWRKTRNYGFWLIGVTVALVIVFDLALDPFAGFIKHFWIWSPTKFPVTWQGAPLSNFLGWGIATGLMLAFATPALIKKQPGARGGADFHPLGVWLGLILLFGVASALKGLWVVVGVDAAIAVVTIVFAIRGARW